MSALIEQILEAAGPMPDAAAHRRYLQTLTQGQLEARLEMLNRPSPRLIANRFEFWRRASALARCSEVVEAVR